MAKSFDPDKLSQRLAEMIVVLSERTNDFRSRRQYHKSQAMAALLLDLISQTLKSRNGLS